MVRGEQRFERENQVLDADEILEVFVQRGCRFVVVGSVARALLDEVVTPRDVDVVVDARPFCRAPVVAALFDLDARVQRRSSWVPVGVGLALPWEWGWKARTVLGEVDVIARFIDGTVFADHDAVATSVSLSSGMLVRCRPTRWAA